MPYKRKSSKKLSILGARARARYELFLVYKKDRKKKLFQNFIFDSRSLAQNEAVYQVSTRYCQN
jgi:hypothetical protein